MALITDHKKADEVARGMKRKTIIVKKPTAAIEQQIAEREQVIKAAVAEIIDTVEKYFLVAPFEWIKGPAEEVGCKAFKEVKSSFNRFDPWFDHWLGQLFPEAHEAQRQLDQGRQGGDAPGELAFAAQGLGFLCGLLVGAKSRGATRDELLRQCDGYILPTMEWERERITEKAGKEAKEHS